MNLQLVILRNIKSGAGRDGMMVTSTLWGEVLMDESRASYSAFRTALRELEEKGQIITVAGQDREKCKLTAAGEARLMEV